MAGVELLLEVLQGVLEVLQSVHNGLVTISRREVGRPHGCVEMGV